MRAMQQRLDHLEEQQAPVPIPSSCSTPKRLNFMKHLRAGHRWRATNLRYEYSNAKVMAEGGGVITTK